MISSRFLIDKNKIFLFLIFVLTTFNFVHAQENKVDTLKTKILKIGVAGNEPFVFTTDGDVSGGIAIEIWEDIALEENWDYEYHIFDSTDKALRKLGRNDLDIVVGPLSITSNRLERMQFSQPFYNSSLAIVSREDDFSLWNAIKPLFSIKLILAVAVFLFILAIVGTLLWLAERNKSPDQFPHDPINGIATGMWLAIVTMSTTGYGDKAPITVSGRIIAGAWMVISIISATSMVAGIASTLTLSSLGTTTITNIEQLSDRKAATVQGSPSENFLRENKVKVSNVASLDDAFDQLKSNDVDAVVYDRPQLLYHLKNETENQLHLAKAEYYKQGYGFAFPKNDNRFIYRVNRALLEHAEKQETVRIIDYYLDKDE
ncbi:MAG: transporter substrate-binding domain-containing protein [Psychroflexus halocasei]